VTHHPAGKPIGLTSQKGISVCTQGDVKTAALSVEIAAQIKKFK